MNACRPGRIQSGNKKTRWVKQKQSKTAAQVLVYQQVANKF